MFQIVSFDAGDGPVVGLRNGDDYYASETFGNARQIIDQWPLAIDKLGTAAERLASRTPLRDVRLLAPLAEPRNIYIVGANYTDHIDEMARALIITPAEPIQRGVGTVAVVSAGTSDEPVAAEAAVTLEFLGHSIDRMTDIGVAGLQRVLSKVERLQAANALIVVAGMEGALPTVVAGLVSRPVIAVPTSVGYGVSLGGFAAMMTMLSSCSAGVTVVNIDNGFGAAVAAAQINQRPVGA